MTLTGYFALNSVFAPVWLAETLRLTKNNCAKKNDKRRLSAGQIFGKDSIVSGNRFVWVFDLVL